MIDTYIVSMRCDERRGRVAHFLRLSIPKGEGYRLPPECRGIRVHQSRAWLTIGGEDKVVACGETVTFEPDRFGAVISSLEASPLLVELLCSPREPGDFVARLWRRLIGHRSAV